MALPCRVSAEGQVASGWVRGCVRACFPVELSNLLPQGLEVRERIGGLGVGRRRRPPLPSPAPFSSGLYRVRDEGSVACGKGKGARGRVLPFRGGVLDFLCFSDFDFWRLHNHCQPAVEDRYGI
jgi:hypothetical protein